MSRAELGDVAEVNGRLARVITINEGHREIGFEFVGSVPCSACGRPDRFEVNEGTPLWSESVKPVTTCGASK